MKTYIVGNWKLNFTVGESSLYLHKLMNKIPAYRDIEVVVAPSTVALQPLSLQVNRHKIHLAAQNASEHDFGPHTGETSFSQIRPLVKYCILGHSERRYAYGETDKIIRAKVAACLRSGLIPILCIGETALEKKEGDTAAVLKDQLLGGLGDVSREEISKVLIAYEPVWAISGHKGAKLAKPDDIQEAINIIRKTLKKTYGEAIASETAVLYGGSVNPDNAAAYLGLDGVNGLLVGGASLISSQFIAIIDAAKRVKNNG